jgi:tetratricopeptide (TPR) repeat protein
MKKTLLAGLMLLSALGGCALPPPYQPPKPVPLPPVQPEPAPVEIKPAPAPAPVEPAAPPPAPAREPTLNPASKALIARSQSQVAAKNFSAAAGSLERALRIEPENPLLWIELGKVRQAEGNFVQAENMGRKAVTMASAAPKARSAAWLLISESYRSRGRNTEAEEAKAKAQSFAGR